MPKLLGGLNPAVQPIHSIVNVNISSNRRRNAHLPDLRYLNTCNRYIYTPLKVHTKRRSHGVRILYKIISFVLVGTFWIRFYTWS